jgi:hypothetical protein
MMRKKLRRVGIRGQVCECGHTPREHFRYTLHCHTCGPEGCWRFNRQYTVLSLEQVMALQRLMEVVAYAGQ